MELNFKPYVKNGRPCYQTFLKICPLTTKLKEKIKRKKKKKKKKRWVKQVHQAQRTCKRRDFNQEQEGSLRGCVLFRTNKVNTDLWKKHHDDPPKIRRLV